MENFESTSSSENSKEKERDVEIKTHDEAKLRTEKIFTPEKIEALMNWIIGEGGIEEDEWSITRKQFDGDGNLLAVDVQVDQEAAQRVGKETLEFCYRIAGNYGRNESPQTNIDCLFQEKDENGDISYGAGNVATYNEEKDDWEITPDKENPTVQNISRADE